MSAILTVLYKNDNSFFFSLFAASHVQSCYSSNTPLSTRQSLQSRLARIAQVLIFFLVVQKTGIFLSFFVTASKLGLSSYMAHLLLHRKKSALFSHNNVRQIE